MFIFFSLLTLHAVTHRDMVSLTHACVTAGIALFHLPYLLLETTDIEEVNGTGRFCASFTLQFMIYDILFCRSAEFIVHHSLAALASFYVLHTGRYETLVLYIEMNEVSTIFLNLAHMNVLRRLNEVLFVLMFIACRIVWLPWILFNKKVSGLLLPIIHIHYVLQIFWLGKIYKRVKRTLRQSSASSGPTR